MLRESLSDDEVWKLRSRLSVLYMLVGSIDSLARCRSPENVRAAPGTPERGKRDQGSGNEAPIRPNARRNPTNELTSGRNLSSSTPVHFHARILLKPQILNHE